MVNLERIHSQEAVIFSEKITTCTVPNRTSNIILHLAAKRLNIKKQG